MFRVKQFFKAFSSRKSFSYRRFAATTTDSARLISGTSRDRLHGLDDAMASATGCSVLDVGCHDGTVAEAFARAGADRIEGCDIFAHGIETAKCRVAAVQPSCEFFVVDLSLGVGELARLPLLRRADIVCYLGIHHHLLKQMARAALVELEAEIFSRAGTRLLVRTPRRYFDDLQRRIVSAGFQPEGDFVVGNVGALRSYARGRSGVQI